MIVTNMKHLLLSNYNVEEIDLPTTKKSLQELLTSVYTEGFQDGYDDGLNEAKALKSKHKIGALD